MLKHFKIFKWLLTQELESTVSIEQYTNINQGYAYSV